MLKAGTKQANSESGSLHFFSSSETLIFVVTVFSVRCSIHFERKTSMITLTLLISLHAFLFLLKALKLLCSPDFGAQFQSYIGINLALNWIGDEKEFLDPDVPGHHQHCQQNSRIFFFFPFSSFQNRQIEVFLLFLLRYYKMDRRRATSHFALATDAPRDV